MPSCRAVVCKACVPRALGIPIFRLSEVLALPTSCCLSELCEAGILRWFVRAQSSQEVMGAKQAEPRATLDLVLLRRKLHALCYDDHLDESSAALVHHLVEDLIRVTEGYRGQKTQLAGSHQQLDDEKARVRQAPRIDQLI